ncbi:MAG TPA: Gfo/Idh/MocA family oxidoreductase [Candidatus Didemnitutus sp.]|nr:Gfo/Idh/MocA family oxidoreductase [Candidatus Didemnitutus sp.]
MTPASPPLRIAVVGAGHHCRTFHLPALRQFVGLHPSVLRLVSLVDPDQPMAIATAASFGFECAHASLEEMLTAARPDACLAITPVAFNAEVAVNLAAKGLPILMEKPLGATIAEARRVVADLSARHARVMVSMNRRFDPFLRDALKWIAARPIRRIKAVMSRVQRTEPEFVEHTGLHVVDVVCSIGGAVTSCTTGRHAPGDGYQAQLAFANGATASIALHPRAQTQSEYLEICGDDFRVEIRSAEFDLGQWRAWSGDRLAKEEARLASTPLFVANGTYAETEAFVRGVRSGGAFSPTPAEVLSAAEICHQLAGSVAARPPSP